MSQVFVSHAERDGPVARELGTGLEKAGFKVWFYERDSLPGATYISQVAEALRECRAVIVIVSPESLKSNQVTNEIVRAYEGNKHFIPVLYGISHDEFRAARDDWRQCLGASTSIAVPEEGVTAIVHRIARGLEHLGINPGVAPAAKSTPARAAEPTRQESKAEPVRPEPKREPVARSAARPPEQKRRLPALAMKPSHRLWVGIGGAVVAALVLAYIFWLRPPPPSGRLEVSVKSWGQDESVSATVTLVSSGDDTSGNQKFPVSGQAVQRELRAGAYAVHVEAAGSLPMSEDLEVVAGSVVTREFRLVPQDYEVTLDGEEVLGIGLGMLPSAKGKLAQVARILESDPWLWASIESNGDFSPIADEAGAYLRDSLKVDHFVDRQPSKPLRGYSEIRMAFFTLRDRGDGECGLLKLTVKGSGPAGPRTADIRLVGPGGDTIGNQEFTVSGSTELRKVLPGNYLAYVESPDWLTEVDTLEIVAGSVVTREFQLLPRDYEVTLTGEEVLGIGLGMLPSAKSKLAQVARILASDPWLRALIESNEGSQAIAEAAEAYLRDSLQVTQFGGGYRGEPLPGPQIRITFFTAD